VLADFHNTLNRWKNYFCQLLNVNGTNDVRRREMITAEPLLPKQSPFGLEYLLKNRNGINHRVLVNFRQN